MEVEARKYQASVEHHSLALCQRVLSAWTRCTVRRQERLLCHEDSVHEEQVPIMRAATAPGPLTLLVGGLEDTHAKARGASHMSQLVACWGMEQCPSRRSSAAGLLGLQVP